MLQHHFCFSKVNPDVVEKLESQGMHFVGHDTENKRMEILEMEGLQRLLFYTLASVICFESFRI